MSTVQVIAQLVVVALLASYLFYKHHQRIRHLLPPPDPKDWTGTGFDASLISDRVKQVRQDYVHELHPPRTSFRQTLLTLARATVRHLAFFRMKHTDLL